MGYNMMIMVNISKDIKMKKNIECDKTNKQDNTSWLMSDKGQRGQRPWSHEVNSSPTS